MSKGKCRNAFPVAGILFAMPISFRAMRLGLMLFLMLTGMLLSTAWAWQHAQRQALLEDASRASQQLGLYANSLHTLIERYRALPAVLALDPELIAALSGPVTAQVQEALNHKLERINGAANSSTLELLDHTGLAVAASNWRLPSTYVGQNYAFRPYFKQTMNQGSGRFYAVGVTSGIPGYFLSSAVKDSNGRFLGAMVVKLEFPELERNGARATISCWSVMPAALSSSLTRTAGATANCNRLAPKTARSWSKPGNTTNSRWYP